MINVKPTVDLSRIKTLSFDSDGTLWNFRLAMENALALTLVYRVNRFCRVCRRAVRERGEST